MNSVSPRLTRRSGLWTVCVVEMLVGGGCKRDPGPPTVVATTAQVATAQVATAPATTRASTQPGPPRSFMDLVRLDYPECPTTQPLDFAVSLKEAAHLRVREPVYLDLRFDLWITRADAPATLDVLKSAANEQTHLTREAVHFVHWRVARGVLTPVLICESSAGTPPEAVALDDRQKRLTRVPLGTAARKYDWPHAFSWGDAIVVPTDVGAVIFEHGDEENWKEMASPPLADPGKAHAPVEISVDYRGLFAWLPPDNGQAAGKTVGRFIDGVWSTLGPNAEWPANLLHLVPLADGSVLQIAGEEGGRVKLGLTGYEPARVDEKLIKHLIYELSDEEQEKRDAAYAKLQTYGGGIWDLLEKALPNQRGEAKSRIESLLRNKTEPTLGNMTLLSNKLRIVSRGGDGGVLCYCEAGVSMPVGAGDEVQTISPAWLSIRPGQAVQLLGGPAWRELDPAHYQFFAVGNRWIVSDEARGPREFVGTYDLQPMLPKSERDFTEVVGTDRRGRWLFRKPASAAQAAATTRAATGPTSPASSRPTTAPIAETLIVDPTLPSMTPRLPVWELAIIGGKTGWNQENYPAFRDEGGNEWIIGALGFQMLDKKKDKLLRTPAEIPALPGAATRTATQAASVPATRSVATARPVSTTRPTTQASTSTPAEKTPPLLIDTLGNRYYGGHTELKIVSKEGNETDWTLPAKAVGSGQVHLVRDRDGRLFLFNEPGRVVRMKPAPGGAEPFVVDATFSRKIPNVDEPTRIWLDPANRIIIAYDENKLAILFPVGHVAKEIADKMPVDAEETNQD